VRACELLYRVSGELAAPTCGPVRLRIDRGWRELRFQQAF
jgi:hypothetical protein